MAAICPTVTAFNSHEYRSQMELLEPFAERIHIDMMDGVFAPTKSPGLETVWWPEHIVADIHLMYQKPAAELEQLIKLKPSLVVFHYEAEVDHKDMASKLKAAGIKAGLAFLQETTVDEIRETLAAFDHVMIFSGKLGYHGSTPNMDMMDKIGQIRETYPDIEIAWDGGVNDQTAKPIVEAGADVLNVGGFIHKAEDPQAAYAKLKAVIGTA